MTTLRARLRDVNKAGAYRLNCPLDELRAAVEQAGFALFKADLATVQGKGEFLATLARAIAAPEWFGHNLDALADALGDLSWRPAPGYVLLLLRDGGETLGLGDAEHGMVMEILAGASAFWKSQGKPFWTFIA